MQDRLNSLLESKGLTATKFAAKIGSSSSTISHILSGRNKPGYDLLYGIAKEFPDINLEWLITGKGSMYYTDMQETLTPPIKRSEPTLFDILNREEELSSQKSLVENKGEDLNNDLSTDKRSTETPSSLEKLVSAKTSQIVIFYDDGTFEIFKPR